MIITINKGQVYYSKKKNDYFVVGPEVSHTPSKRSYHFINSAEFKGYNKIDIPKQDSRPQYDVESLIGYLNDYGYKLLGFGSHPSKPREETLFNIDDL
jgi:hypothetical protein